MRGGRHGSGHACGSRLRNDGSRQQQHHGWQLALQSASWHCLNACTALPRCLCAALAGGAPAWQTSHTATACCTWRQAWAACHPSPSFWSAEQTPTVSSPLPAACCRAACLALCRQHLFPTRSQADRASLPPTRLLQSTATWRGRHRCTAPRWAAARAALARYCRRVATRG